MAALLLTKLGDRIVARWSGGNVLVTFNDDAELTAFALAAESALDMDEEPDGAIVITYLSGGAVTFKRTRDRVTWT